MLLELARHTKTDKATLGTLYVDGQEECFTLEDVVRDLGPDGKGKIKGETAIPAGKYKVIINYSPRFKRTMMRLLDVPFFDGILIHCGNTHDNTEGCILVGSKIAGDDLITGSTIAYNKLRPKVEEALNRGDEVWIEIVNDF